jgi:hypothetical protein
MMMMMMIIELPAFLIILLMEGSGNRSRYSDLLLAGRAGVRIPVRAVFFATVQTGPGTRSAYYIMGTESLSRA